MTTRDEYYAWMADMQEAKRHREFQTSDGQMPMTQGWSRYRPSAPRIRVTGPGGKTVRLSPKQYEIYSAVGSREGDTITMTVLANSMGVSVSTVSRALLLLSAFKLVAYDVVRGRYGGITILSTGWADLKARSRMAWDRIRHTRERAWDRYVRKLDKSGYFWSGLNVASIEEVNATLTT